jgi:hypothetical protein
VRWPRHCSAGRVCVDKHCSMPEGHDAMSVERADNKEPNPDQGRIHPDRRTRRTSTHLHRRRWHPIRWLPKGPTHAHNHIQRCLPRSVRNSLCSVSRPCAKLGNVHAASTQSTMRCAAGCPCNQYNWRHVPLRHDVMCPASALMPCAASAWSHTRRLVAISFRALLKSSFASAGAGHGTWPT